MNIYPHAADDAVKNLLAACRLPTADITPEQPAELFACGAPQEPDAVIGMERYGAIALLRSLAVVPGKRGQGIGAALVRHLEERARALGVRELYLLTETAEPFFARLGYVKAAREQAPPAIRATTEFAGLCPASATFMQKQLSAGDAPGFTTETIGAGAGAAITARFFAPKREMRGAVLIVPAMGVAQPYYAALAAWLAEQDFLTATFDYRGIGLSRTGPLRTLDVDIFDWAQVDCARALDALAQRAGGKPLYWLGHSLGGQIIPFVPNWRQIAKFITIGTGSGYWRENSAPLNKRAWFFWHVLAPLTVRLFGYFPGKRLRLVGDLPPAVVKQWRRWCLHPDYAAGAEGERARTAYAAVTTPIVSLSFTDDEFMSARNTESLHGFYTNAPCTMKRLTPAQVGVNRIGHFGFFRPEFESTLWRPYLLPELA